MHYGIPDTVFGKILEAIQSCSKVEEAVLFGSRAKGNYRPGSDIDIALKGVKVSLAEKIGIEIFLGDAIFPYKLDLVIYGDISEPALKEHIDRAGVSLFQRELIH